MSTDRHDDEDFDPDGREDPPVDEEVSDEMADREERWFYDR